MSTLVETLEAQLAKSRVTNATGLAIKQDGHNVDPAVGVNGAIVYALLDVANAIRSFSVDKEKTRRLLLIADFLVDYIAEGADPKEIKRLADSFHMEQQGFNVDQPGVSMIPEMRKDT